MTQFDTLYQASAEPALSALFGESITILPKNGAPVPVTATAVYRMEDVAAAINQDGADIKPMVRVSLPSSALSGVTVNEFLRAIIDNETYGLVGRPSTVGSQMMLVFRRISIREKSMQDFRSQG